jgi:hypothetical protein
MEFTPLILEEKEIDLIKIDELKTCYGVIIMLDSLGTKNLSIEDSKIFIRNVDFIVKNAMNFSKNIFFNNKNIGIWERMISTSPKIFAFQDTFIIAIETGTQDYVFRILDKIGEFIAHIIVAGLNQGIYLRGAISIGDFIEYDNRFYLGDAVSDAASWYEKADWIGVIFTPKTGQLLNYINKVLLRGNDNEFNIDQETFNWLFSFMQVPLKEKNMPLWVVNFPFALNFERLNTDMTTPTLEYYYKIMKKASIPYGTESKYLNTNGFVEWYYNQYPNLLNIEVKLDENQKS